MGKQYLEWTEIARWSNLLADKIAKDCPDLAQITLAAVSRGGLVPTQLIAYKLDVRDIRVIKLMSYDDKNQRGEIEDISTDELFDKNSVYIIDDLADSGATIKYLRHKYPSAKFCTLLKKDCCKDEPDFYVEAGISADTWIVFPWD